MVTYTSSSLYWSPLKPRIRIYAFNDSTYSSPIYTYNPFTDVGSTTKPIALNFDSQTTNVGTFSIEIEDKDSELDPDTFMRGNRVFIDCSKDGSTYQPAFKGLVRSTNQNIYAVTGRNLVIQGYSYLVRLNERVLNTIKESTLSGEDYDRTDSNMFTDNLIFDLLNTDANYVYSADDTGLYSIFKRNNITSSPVTDWIPRLDAQLVTVNDAINSVLEFSNSLVMLNPADDELVLYNPDQVTSATGIFLLTNQINQNADDADYTMYPLEGYKYNISYDYPDSGSRLIGSIGSIETEPCVSTDVGEIGDAPIAFWYSAIGTRDLATGFYTQFSPITNIGFVADCIGDVSFITSMTGQIRDLFGTTGIGSPLSPNMPLYRDGIPGKAFPSKTTTGFVVKQAPGATGPAVSVVGDYYLYVVAPSGQDLNNKVRWMIQTYNRLYAYQDTAAGHMFVSGSGVGYPPDTTLKMGYNLQLPTDTCGGGTPSQATIDADPVFAVAHDRNMSNRLGVVEKVMSAIPTHIKTRQTLQEYLFSKLYYAAKPRFTFDFPSVSMPNKLPKAGDIVAHVDTKTRVGTTTAPIQTGVISQVQYDFAQGSGENDALGLRKLSLSTTGIRRGSY